MGHCRPTQQDDIQDELNAKPRISKPIWHVTTIHEGLGGDFYKKKFAIRHAKKLKTQGESFAIWEGCRLRDDIIV